MNKKQTIHKAVIPAAGLGTRFLPVTKSMPKEMLPVIDKPVIHYVVEEAVASGIDDIIIITGRGKRAIEDYFDAAPELEMHLRDRQKDATLRRLQEISAFPAIHYVRQKDPDGLGDAILRAERHIGSDPFAVLLGDDIVTGPVPCTRQLIGVFSRFSAPVISVERVPRDRVSRYGIISGENLEEDIIRVRDIVEKPEPQNALSDLGAVGRYILIPEIFDRLKSTPPGRGKEVQLTDAIRLLLETHPVYACLFRGKRYDTGDKLGYIQTIVDFALEDPGLKPGLTEFLKGKVSV